MRRSLTLVTQMSRILLNLSRVISATWKYVTRLARQGGYVFHQAALGSMPQSIEDPITTYQANIDGFLNMLIAARDADVKRFVYAALISTYGNYPYLPKVEGEIGNPLSPCAVTRMVNELFANVSACRRRTRPLYLASRMLDWVLARALGGGAR